jgi:hypothetical protein
LSTDFFSSLFQLAPAHTGTISPVDNDGMHHRFPARLHVLLASAAPVGVVLRRGPVNAVCSILWNRETDEFRIGQWVRARIYERRSDISPDGRHMIYFARSARWQSETKGSYTAVSRVPWLKAVVLFGKGDCWQGGGLFTSSSQYWLNGGCCHFLIRDSGEITSDPDFRPTEFYGGECPGVYYPRLQRDGWVLKDRLDAGLGTAMAVFEKALPNGWTLRKYAHAEAGTKAQGRGCYWDEHELEHSESHERISLPKWEWADLDGTTLVWAEDGLLKRATLDRNGLGNPKILYNFNGLEFERRTAPY